LQTILIFYMKINNTFVKFLLPVVLLISTQIQAVDKNSFQQEAQDFVASLKKSFMRELESGLKKGAYKSIDICHLKVPHIQEGKINEKFEFGRTSHKVRNLTNTPKEWLRPIVAEYRKSSEANPLRPKVVMVDKRMAYVEPIYVKPVCLQCHGNPVESVQKKISKLYPKDQAVGFKLGEFRGLFWVLQRSSSD